MAHFHLAEAHTFCARFARITNPMPPCPNPRPSLKNLAQRGRDSCIFNYFVSSVRPKLNVLLFQYFDKQKNNNNDKLINNNNNKKKVSPKPLPEIYSNFARPCPKMPRLLHWNITLLHCPPPPPPSYAPMF